MLIVSCIHHRNLFIVQRSTCITNSENGLIWSKVDEKIWKMIYVQGDIIFYFVGYFCRIRQRIGRCENVSKGKTDSV